MFKHSVAAIAVAVAAASQLAVGQQTPAPLQRPPQAPRPEPKMDPERAKKESPFGGPIAHGYYTLSLAPHLMEQIVAVKGIRMGINYGLNKLRYPGPVRIGKRVRLKASLVDFEDIANGAGAQATVGMTFEVEGESKPGCVAEAVYRYYK